jgi:hypothetical protein
MTFAMKMNQCLFATKRHTDPLRMFSLQENSLIKGECDLALCCVHKK